MENNVVDNISDRKIYVDALKILAMFFVVYSHSDIYTLYYSQQSVCKTWIYMFAAMIAKTGVPLFFMASGALLLGKKDTYVTSLKRIFRFVFIIAFFESFSWFIRWRSFPLGG